MSFDVDDLDAACLAIGDDFTFGGNTFQMVPNFSPDTVNSDVYEVTIVDRLTAQTTQAVINTVSLARESVVVHVRTGKSFEVMGFYPDATEWVTVELERAP